MACYYEPQWDVVAGDFLSEELGKLQHINMLCNFDPTYFLVIKAAFQISEAYEARLPEGGDMIYH